ncbi:Transcriptional regulator, GntR family [Pseudonocardia sp. Ae168_Ps1]|uniref:GntR family transcriptional regulator n=1 Tax=unclassified Pseudonocardia TaxID=2619320 RepID=UPI0009666467|nr:MULTISPECIES: GntR family transcriptional regulator [unclassified Pseudonocardia]OLL76107.1 Transcriptional regulator, GntR family [Pseudonocardia sp. Ae150A_Ps1]OLL82105.1 Transcriptional regulator, GntR family [Pseudonocardia sp. Ae168_Ps1]OLL83781.1 Transcriptional regulator, GntR family [Pseudonocardia sp. Ae263_Ps1]OLL90179.1 Transcriptional regulator, GntR family [Pseudonocardia sp. Ae356_Ps1]
MTALPHSAAHPDLLLEFDTPVSMADRAYVALRDQLIMLVIPPLAPIDDEGISAVLGLGRTPVREAIKRLQSERLLVSYPRRGTFATAVDISDLRDVSDVRTALEPLAARRAAESAPPARRAELRALAERIRALDSGRTGRTELMRWDVAVHRSMYRAAGNPYLEDTLTHHHNLATRIHCLFLERLDHVDRHVGEHGDMLAAIADGDAARAEAICREHVTGFERAVRAVL